MKNRILALLLILIICISMMPLNVFAASTQELNIVKQEIKTNGYTINYYTPQGYSEVFILKQSDTKYHIYFVEVGGQFLCNVSGYSKITAKAARIKNITSLDEVYAIIFEGKYKTYSCDTFIANEANYTGNYTIHSSADRMYVSPSIESLGSVNTQGHIDQSIREDYMTFNDFYGEWYFSINGYYPRPETDNAEFMKGNYYVILSQESIITDVSLDLDTGKTKYKGFVETTEYVELESKTMTSIDGKNRGLNYVVISSEGPTGDILSPRLEDGLGSFILSSIGSFEVWLDIGTRRNDYDIINYFFYNKSENLNRYYFNSIQDACKFVLYGTAGAKYLHKEEGVTDYGYGYVSCEYNNYDITRFPAKKIPEESYPLGRQTIVLTQHDVKGEGRQYVYIDMNYYSRVSMIDPENNLIINNKYSQPIYSEYIEGTEEFNPLDKKIYKVTSKYSISNSSTFKIYNKDFKDDTGTWDIIYSTYNIYQTKQGQIIDGDEFPPVIQVWQDKDGNIVVENTTSGEAFKNGDTDAYVKNENGEYINSNGDKWDKENYTNEILDWQTTLKDYQNDIEQLADIIKDFTIFINSSTDEVGEITGLLNAVMLSFPSIFRTLILMSVIALICGRIIKRK